MCIFLRRGFRVFIRFLKVFLFIKWILRLEDVLVFVLGFKDGVGLGEGCLLV